MRRAIVTTTRFGLALPKSFLVAALTAASFLALGSPAHGAEAFHTTAIGGLALPQYIGPLEFIGEHSGPEGEQSASYSYRAAGLALEISVTDLGAGGVADGAAAPELIERYAEAKQDVITSTKVRRLKPKRESMVVLSDAPLGHAASADTSARLAREAFFTLSRKHGQSGGATYLIFTAAHGLVVDARFDVAAGFEEDGSISHGEILAALGAAIPASTQPVVAARARLAEQRDAAMKVAIVWDPATPAQEGRIWLAYLFARAAYAASETDTAPAVGEREASFEEEVRGRMIAVTTFRDLKRNDAQLASVYFSDIDRVEAAGFLREYVWSYLRHAGWRVPPADLNLTAFDEWRATHLMNHVPVTHGRITFRLASR